MVRRLNFPSSGSVENPVRSPLVSSCYCASARSLSLSLSLSLTTPPPSPSALRRSATLSPAVKKGLGFLRIR
ncbi:hypothetical protein NL676_012561 [Syzygium grande]|nr:hypothetical protein NL676_012561 [Syzygium grande]